MKFPLFSRIVLSEDIPAASLCRGDLATIVEHYETPGVEPGYEIEVFDATGHTVAVVTVGESQIEAPRSNERPCVRLEARRATAA